MTDTALDDALTIMAHFASDEPRAWAGPPWPMSAASLGLSIRPASLIRQGARLTLVLLVLPCCLVVWWVLGAGATHAASPPSSRLAEVWPVEAAFREAVQLWADEQFEVLWERGLLSSRYRVSREAFVRGCATGCSNPPAAGVGSAPYGSTSRRQTRRWSRRRSEST